MESHERKGPPKEEETVQNLILSFRGSAEPRSRERSSAPNGLRHSRCPVSGLAGSEGPTIFGSKPSMSSPLSPGWQGCSICQDCSSTTLRRLRIGRFSHLQGDGASASQGDHQPGDDPTLFDRLHACLPYRRLAGRLVAGGFRPRSWPGRASRLFRALRRTFAEDATSGPHALIEYSNVSPNGVDGPDRRPGGGGAILVGFEDK